MALGFMDPDGADPVLRREYQQARGKDGLVRANWAPR